MKVSLKWLDDHIDLSGLNTEDIAGLLTFSGIEVESIEATGVASDLLVVAKILSSVPHPNADKLSVCQVDDGSGSPRQIVCGAKNYREGDHVPLALPGASFGDFQIKAGKLRGVESMGMMCSGREIGIGGDHEGLFILNERPAPGALIRDLYPPDTVFELEITPNRPDCLSHLGVARELHALTGRALKPLSHSPPHGNGIPPRPATDEELHLSDPDGCPFYTARRITGVTVGESPEWLKAKLESIGLRPINNIVDITNYVLMEIGQPLHAFDLSRLNGGIIVRSATAAETITALDDKQYSLDPNDLVIADESKALAIAGIMGGAETGVTESTTDILLESAYFAPSRIRQTSRRLGLTSDSSYRFERGADPAQAQNASELAVQLIVDLAGGSPEEQAISIGTAPTLVHQVPLDPEFCSRTLGCAVSNDQIATILARLGLAPAPGKEPGHKDGEALWCIPSYRLDLQRPIDLVEEVARIHGLDKIPSRNLGPTADTSKADLAYDARMRARRQLAAQGFHECTTLKLIARNQLTDGLGLGTRSGAVVALKNPLTEDQTHMRTSIVPGLLASLARNLRAGASNIRLFEVGTCFLDEPRRPGHSEIQQLAIAMTGKVTPPCWINPDPGNATFHDLRGAVEALVPRCAITFSQTSNQNFPLCADIRIDGKPAGLAAQVAPARARELGFDGAVLVAEIDLTILQRQSSQSFRVAELPRFPSAARDVAIEIPTDLPVAEVDAFFARQNEPLLVDVQLFDVFTDPTGEKLPAGRRSVAYTLTYRDCSATLRTEQVDESHARILEALKRDLPATIR